MPQPQLQTRPRQAALQTRSGRRADVVDDPTDLGLLRRLVHLDELGAKIRYGNRRLLDHEDVGQGWCPCGPAFERIARSSLVGRPEGPGPKVRLPSPRSPGRRPR